MGAVSIVWKIAYGEELVSGDRKDLCGMTAVAMWAID